MNCESSISVQNKSHQYRQRNEFAWYRQFYSRQMTTVTFTENQFGFQIRITCLI